MKNTLYLINNALLLLLLFREKLQLPHKIVAFNY